jgi:hypothetical protein
VTTYYVGPGGSDSNDGQSWANRKLTLNGAEDIPVAAGDTVYVGPGTYRCGASTSALTLDVSGSSGSPITYIGDWTGENTDGVGGTVRITGLLNDDGSSITTTSIVVGSSIDYRTFRGFFLTGTNSVRAAFNLTDCENIIIEDCVIMEVGYGVQHLYTVNTTYSNTIRRCYIIASRYFPVNFDATTGQVLNSGDTIENCLLGSASAGGIRIDACGGISFDSCTFHHHNEGIRVWEALPTSYTAISVDNCVFVHGSATALRATTSGEIVEDYNTFSPAAASARINVATGSNSVTYPGLLEPLHLLDGFDPIGPHIGQLSEWSQVAQITGTSQPSDDITGKTRPATASKKSWGAFQFTDTERDEATTYNNSAASLVMHDAGRTQFKLPVQAVGTTISVRVYRETNYAGTLPQMVIKQPGESDRTTTDTGSAETWNLLTDTFTPGTGTDYVIVELVSNNTATSGDYDVYFDNLAAN